MRVLQWKTDDLSDTPNTNAEPPQALICTLPVTRAARRPNKEHYLCLPGGQGTGSSHASAPREARRSALIS